MVIHYILAGETAAILLPPPAFPARRDGLWRHTCFEAFIRHPDGSYWEFNFSPSTEWAAYSFTGYREGMRDLEIESPHINATRSAGQFQLDVELPLPPRLPSPMCLNLAAVIEDKTGNKTYWALVHPPGPPDFHHPDCFGLELPAPSGT